MRHPYIIYTFLLPLILVYVAISHAELLNGTQLYAKHCAKCHNDIKNTNRAGRRASRIQSAINANIGGMASLKGLNSGEIQAISDALIRLEAPANSINGRELYRIYCSSCHKPIENSSIRSKMATDIMAAMNARRCKDIDLGFLKHEDRLKIADALRPPKPEPTHSSK